MILSDRSLIGCLLRREGHCRPTVPPFCLGSYDMDAAFDCSPGRRGTALRIRNRTYKTPSPTMMMEKYIFAQNVDNSRVIREGANYGRTQKQRVINTRLLIAYECRFLLYNRLLI